MQKFTPFLMFTGQAEEAINFYTSVFPQAKIEHIIRYEAGQSGTEGSVMRAVFSLDGQEYMCIDSNVQHEFTFTPSFSIFVQCETEAEIDNVCARLFDGGAFFMPLGNYGFSEKFVWGADKFGVSWQLNLEHNR